MRQITRRGRRNPEDPQYVVFYDDVHDLPTDPDTMAGQLWKLLGNKTFFKRINEVRAIYNMPPFKSRKHYLKDTLFVQRWLEALAQRDQEYEWSSAGKAAHVIRRIGVYDDVNELSAESIPGGDVINFFWGLYTSGYYTFFAFDGIFPVMLQSDGGVLLIRNYNNEILSGVPWSVRWEGTTAGGRERKSTLVIQEYPYAAQGVDRDQYAAIRALVDAWAEQAEAQANVKIDWGWGK